MKLSLPVIAEKLDFAVLSRLPEGASKELRLSRPVFYTDEKVLKADTLYLCKGLSLPAKISAEDGCALICIGFPEKTASDKAIDDILILDKDVDILKLGNAVNKIFDFYENLEEEQKLLSEELTPSAVLSRLLKDGIATGSISKMSLDSELKQVMDWDSTGDFKVLLIRPKNKEKSASLGNVCRNLIRKYPEIVSFVYQQAIVIVIKISSKFKKENYEQLLQILKKNSFRIGVSNDFSSIYDVGKFYKQAHTAMDIGVIENPEEDLHFFESCTLSYIYGKATEEFDKQDISSPVYLRLEKYDKEYHTDYLKTLKVYLFNNQNAVQTAKDLYIARATIIYRIRRICEIGQTKLTDPAELLHLYFTFGLLER